MRSGDVPRKHHIQLRGRRRATLRYEECFTRDGFDGPYTILYHQRRAAHAARRRGAARLDRCRRRPPSAPLAQAPLPDAASCERGGGPPIDARVPLLFNADVTLGVRAPDRAGPGLLRQRRRRRAVLHPRGRRHAAHRCSATCASRRATTCSCRAACCTASSRRGRDAALALDRVLRRACTSRSSGATRSASCAWTRPTATATSRARSSRAPCDEGIRELVVKRGGAFHGFTLRSTRRSTWWAGTAPSTRGRSRS